MDKAEEEKVVVKAAENAKNQGINPKTHSVKGANDQAEC